MTTLRHAALAGATLLFIACTPQSQDKAPVVVVEPLGGPPAATAPVAPPSVPTVKGLHPIDAAALAIRHVNAPGSCNVEAVNQIRFSDTPVVVNRKPITFSGWFLPERSKRTGIPGRLRLTHVSGTQAWEIAIEAFQPRPNVNAVMKGLDAGNTGFSQVVDPTGLPAGRYLVSLVFVDEGVALACDKAGGKPGAIGMFDLK
jgi:hypothetical protein